MNPPPKRVVTITTDFGTSDTYVAQMKGVILSIDPGAVIVDGTHHVPSHDIFAGAYLLNSFYKFFPSGSIHIVVVDPGVGTGRRGLLISTPIGYFVGPDNGLFTFPVKDARRAGGMVDVFQIKEERFLRHPISNTFHGRDVFAPCAAHLSRGVRPELFGPSVKDPILIEFPEPYLKGGRMIGEVIHIDRFGNLVTNIEREDLKRLTGPDGPFLLEFKGRMIEGPSPSYQAVPGLEFLAIWGSAGFLEVSVNSGSAAGMSGAGRGERVIVSRRR